MAAGLYTSGYFCCRQKTISSGLFKLACSLRVRAEALFGLSAVCRKTTKSNSKLSLARGIILQDKLYG